MQRNSDKSKIDTIRDSALSMTVGDENDGDITGFVNVADQDKFVIKEHSIFRMILADEIDPKRTNEGIPNSNQRIASAGSASEIVSRSFLTADALFNTDRFGKKFDRKPIMDVALEIMKELLAAEKIQDKILLAEEEAKAGIQQPKGRAFTIPSIDNLEENFKVYVQKIEHTAQAVFRLTQIFYDHKEKMFDGFAGKINSEYGPEDEFTKFAQEMADFMVFVRNMRHCIEHPKPKQKIIIQDFSLCAAGELSNPSVEIVHSKTPIPKMAVNDFLQRVLNNTLSFTEELICHLATKHITPFGKMDIAIGLIPEEQRRRGSRVRYGYLIDVGNGWSRLG